VPQTGGSGPARVWGHVKLHSIVLGENTIVLKAPRV